MNVFKNIICLYFQIPYFCQLVKYKNNPVDNYIYDQEKKKYLSFTNKFLVGVLHAPNNHAG